MVVELVSGWQKIKRVARRTKFGRRWAIASLEKEIKKLDSIIEEKLKGEEDPNERRYIRQFYTHDIFLCYDQIDIIKTEGFLASNRGLNVAIPQRADGSDYWKALEDFGEWVLTEEGFEYLDKKFHDARMRKNERFQSWFTPITAIIAIILSAVAIMIQIPPIATLLNIEANPPLLHDPEPPRP